MMLLFHAVLVLLTYQVVSTEIAESCGPDQCKFGGQCHDVGDRWQHECITYKCVYSEGLPVAIKKRIRCPWQNGFCKRIGTIKRSKCNTFKCKEDLEGKYAFGIIKKECRAKGRCYKPGTEITFRNKPPCFCTKEARLVCAVN